ncbi:hypothetical protein [Clostridium hydrogeniformans]|uniref:hypothetical protein n=1 Tax=Clostridium hydrogeniformans TaxID=349933 RepID=UPI0004886E60|nr:hypothetical protein [Clostridium hydrogeniformans]
MIILNPFLNDDLLKKIGKKVKKSNSYIQFYKNKISSFQGGRQLASDDYLKHKKEIEDLRSSVTIEDLKNSDMFKLDELFYIMIEISVFLIGSFMIYRFLDKYKFIAIGGFFFICATYSIVSRILKKSRLNKKHIVEEYIDEEDFNGLSSDLARVEITKDEEFSSIEDIINKNRLLLETEENNVHVFLRIYEEIENTLKYKDLLNALLEKNIGEYNYILNGVFFKEDIFAEAMLIKSDYIFLIRFSDIEGTLFYEKENLLLVDKGLKVINLNKEITTLKEKTLGIGKLLKESKIGHKELIPIIICFNDNCNIRTRVPGIYHIKNIHEFIRTLNDINDNLIFSKSIGQSIKEIYINNTEEILKIKKL